MYASNENEDWIYLHGASPINPLFRKVVNIVDSEDFSSSSSSSFNSRCSNSSSSSQLDRSVSLSSISSTEVEHSHSENLMIQNHIVFSSIHDRKKYPDLEEEIDLLATKNSQNLSSILVSDSSTQTSNVNTYLPSQVIVPQVTHNTKLNKNIDASHAINENHVFYDGLDSKYLKHDGSVSSKSFSLPNSHRCRRRCRNVQTTKCEMAPSILMSKETKSERNVQPCQHKNNTSISSMYIIVLLTLPFMLGHFITRWDQSTIVNVVDELVRTHQRSNDLKDVSISHVNDKLTEQFEEKFQNMIHQQLMWHGHEKYALSLQIQQLRQILKLTQDNLTNTVHQLTQENVELNEKLKSLENRLGLDERKDLKIAKSCIDGVNCTKSTLDKLVHASFDHAGSITPDTSVRLLGIFEYLSASVNNIVDHRREYMNKSKQRLVAFASSSILKNVRTTFFRSLENLSSTFHKAKLTYMPWIKSYAHDQNRIEDSDKKRRYTHRKSSIHWNFLYRFNQKRKWHQKTSKNYICDSKSNFSMQKMCLIKNWLAKFFRLS